ncbi:hypothetical protein EHQ16_11055 [Leptospira kanakyensis]|uniref:Uncharacterized protein n=1 Tax=Leptospira kanakyensis TaxID=2484968 RepID=A0A6N4QGQ3_9LEPT|nr:hypothetical protein [Leptospira kanakyensis]TGK51720.1 hypothetical protein EHQ11_08195 [Leptospira kanakyensis]TGK59797.1 hypothetical protein EHQ16_11055 [Leptospira kanakyensis]TGK71960.1 hypothetical protein EHQ18_07415 [Leptospira kanakyensis]
MKNTKKTILCYLTLIFAVNFSIYSEPSDLYDVTVIKKFYSPDKKYRAELLKHNFYDSRCLDEFPVSLDRSSEICQFRIYNNRTNKIEYRVVAEDEKKENYKKCPNVHFPLSVAYGFHSLKKDKLIFSVNYEWYAIDDPAIEYFEFDWKSCITKGIWKYSESHCPDYCQFITYLKEENKYYIFYYNEITKTVDGEINLHNNKQSENFSRFNFFFDEGKDFPILKKNISKNLFKIPVTNEPNHSRRTIGTNPDFPNVIIYVDSKRFLFNLKTNKLSDLN